MIRVMLLLAGLATVSFPALAAPAGLQDGTYDFFNCEAPVSDTRVELKGDRIIYFESSCILSNPDPVPGIEGAVLFDAECRGEGQDWWARLFLMNARDGSLVHVRSGWGARYKRCD